MLLLLSVVAEGETSLKIKQSRWRRIPVFCSRINDARLESTSNAVLVLPLQYLTGHVYSQMLYRPLQH